MVKKYRQVAVKKTSVSKFWTQIFVGWSWSLWTTSSKFSPNFNPPVFLPGKEAKARTLTLARQHHTWCHFFSVLKNMLAWKKYATAGNRRYWLISARDNIMIWDCSFESQSLLFSEKSLCVYLRVLCEILQKRGKHKSCHDTRVVEIVGSNSLRALAWMTWKDI